MLTSLTKFPLSKCRMPLKSYHPCSFLLHYSSSQYPNPSIHLQSPQRNQTQLIHRYCRAGRIRDARKLFDEMPERNIVAYSTMIYGYSSNGFFRECFEVFTHMLKLGLCPNSYTMVSVLLGSAGFGVLSLAECFHGRVIKSGLEANPFVITAVLNCYAKCKSPMRSYALLEEMVEANLVTFNAMIAGFVFNDLFEEALLLFKRILVFGLVPSSVTMINVVQGCVGYGLFGLCESIYGYVIKIGLDLDVSLMNAVFSMYLSFGDLQSATQFFRKLVVKDVITLSAMMSFLLDLGRAHEVLNLFVEMRANGIDPDMVVMVNMVIACTILCDARRGKLVHNQIIVCGFGLELPIMNSLITMYSKCADLGSSRVLFNCIKEKSLVSWTAMISAYVQNRNPTEGLRLLSEVRKEDKYMIDSVTMVTLLVASRELANFDLCKQFHAYSFKLGLSLCKRVQNSLVALYGKCGYAMLARRVFDEMVSRDAVSWNTMITSYGINSKGEAAVSLFHDMEKSGEEPDEVTYLNALMACSHSCLLNDGLTIFRRMVKEKGIKPGGEHLGCMVDMLARAGLLEDARKLVNSIQEDASLNAWKALLGGCHLHSDMELATVAADKVLQMESSDFGHVVLLSNAYASIRKFDVVESLRSCSVKKTVMKNLGLSSLDAISHDVG
ncbi:pentatricopeptide repeat-containing protein At3g03580-like [Typha angustifolia]|uniref:pentatricopeptide repeat-containing protein At3g03580-like n=1 Tax=Typha angustifolia TaxID=59011 RepID=UPI003C2F7EFC